MFYLIKIQEDITTISVHKIDYIKYHDKVWSRRMKK